MEKKYILRCIAYKEPDNTFTGVCLDLDLVEEGHASIQEAMLSINEAIDTHISAAKKLGFPKELMVRPAPDAYWKKLQAMTTPKVSHVANYREILSNPFKFYNISPHVAI